MNAMTVKVFEKHLAAVLFIFVDLDSSNLNRGI